MGEILKKIKEELMEVLELTNYESADVEGNHRLKEIRKKAELALSEIHKIEN